MRVRSIPQIGIQPGGLGGGFNAPRVVPFNNPTGQQMQQAGAAITRSGIVTLGIAKDVQDRLDDANIKAGDAQLREAATKLYDGYKPLRGLAAKEARAATLKQFEDKYTSLLGAMDNPVQRDVFMQAAAEQRTRFQSLVQTHHDKQARVADFGASAARAEGAINARTQALLAGDQAAADEHEGVALTEVDSMANMMGLGPEEKAARATEARTKMHAQVIGLLVDDRPDVASAYFAKHAAEMDPENRAKLGAAVAKSTLNAGADKLAQSMTSQFMRGSDRWNTEGVAVPGPDGTQIDVMTWDRAQGKKPDPSQAPPDPITPLVNPRDWELRALKELDKRTDVSPEVKSATLANIRYRAGLEREKQATKAADIEAQAEAWLIENPKEGLDRMPSELYTNARGLGLLPKLAQLADSGFRKVTPIDEFAKALDMPPAQWQAMSDGELTLRYSHFAPEDLRLLRAKKAEADGRATADQFKIISEDQQITEAAVRLLGIDRDDKRRDEQQRRQLYDFKVWTQKEVKEAGGKLTPEGLQAIYDRAAKNVVLVDVTGTDPTRSVVSLKRPYKDAMGNQYGSDEQFGAYVNTTAGQVYLRDIPANKRASIESRLRAAGLDVTEFAIAQVWAKEGRQQ